MHDRAPHPDDGRAPAIDIVQEMLLATTEGTMPTFDGPQLAERLRLAGEEPDHLTLIERFAGSSPSEAELFSDLGRALVGILRGAEYLIGATNRREANPAEEAVAQALGHVVTQQIIREGDICPRARELALASTRSDLIPAEVRDRLRDAAGPELALQQLIAAVLGDIDPTQIRAIVVHPFHPGTWFGKFPPDPTEAPDRF